MGLLEDKSADRPVDNDSEGNVTRINLEDRISSMRTRRKSRRRKGADSAAIAARRLSRKTRRLKTGSHFRATRAAGQ